MTALALLALAGSVAAREPGTVTFGIAPGSRPASTDPRAAYAIVDHIDAGDRLERRLRFHNGTEEEITVDFTDEAARLREGAFGFGDVGAENELTRWVDVTPRRAAVPPGDDADVRVSLRVPRDVRPREHYGMVWAAIGPTARSGSTTRTRVGVRMYVHVGDGDHRTAFAVERVRPSRTSGGDARVQVRVANTGARAVDVVGTVGVDRASSERARFAIAVAPHSAADATVALEVDAPDEPLPLVLRTSGNGIQRLQRAEVTFPREAGVTGQPVGVDAPGGGSEASRSVPGVLAVGLLLAAALLLLGHRRRP